MYKKGKAGNLSGYQNRKVANFMSKKRKTDLREMAETAKKGKPNVLAPFLIWKTIIDEVCDAR